MARLINSELDVFTEGTLMNRKFLKKITLKNVKCQEKMFATTGSRLYLYRLKCEGI